MDAPENYRKIELLPTINKKLNYTTMFNFISKNKTFSSRQFGLRWKRSCAYAVAEITEKIRFSVNIKKPMCISDITKAFDAIDHSIFARRLDNFSFRVYFNGAIQSYFNNRQKYYCFQCKATEIKNIGDTGLFAWATPFLKHLLAKFWHRGHVVYDDTKIFL